MLNNLQGTRMYYAGTGIEEFKDCLLKVINEVDRMNDIPVYLCENKDGIQKKVLATNLSKEHKTFKEVLYNADYTYLPTSVPRFKTGV